jgi:hypothetical protein
MSENTNENTNENTDNLDQLKTSNESLLNKNQELLNELKQIKSQVNELGGLDTVKQAVKTQKQLEQEALEKESNVEQLKNHFNEQIRLANEKNETLVKGIVDTKVETLLKTAVTQAKGSYALLEPQLKKHIDASYEDGQVKVTVKDSAGMPMMIDGREASINDLIDYTRKQEEYSRAFDNTPAMSGSGAPVGSAKQLVEQPKSLDELTELYKKNPQRALEAMKARGIV